jgi:hypothetical protein
MKRKSELLHKFIRGFKFKDVRLSYAGAMDRYIGEFGEIVDVDSFGRLSEPESTQPCLEVWPFGMGESSWSFTGNRFKVIDAAASFDALQGVGNRMQDATAGTLSLHATKALAGTEGGIFFSTNSSWVERMRKWINFGFSPGSRAPCY